MGFTDLKDLLLLQIFGERRLSLIGKWLPVNFHTLQNPKLTYQADRAFFLGKSVDTLQLSPDYLTEDQKTEEQKTKALKPYVLLTNKDIMQKCGYLFRYDFYCRFFIPTCGAQKNI